MSLHPLLPMRSRRAVAIATAASVTLAACSPALDWREVRPVDSRLLLLMPCRPLVHERSVPLAGQTVKLALQACDAGGQTWGLAVAELNDPGRVAPALAELGALAASNIGARAGPSLPIQILGATPHPGQHRLRLSGHLPDGKAVTMQLVVFSHGTRVFQATVLGEQVPDDAAEMFFGALRIQP